LSFIDISFLTHVLKGFGLDVCFLRAAPSFDFPVNKCSSLACLFKLDKNVGG
jgi:hypothetical protein